MRNCFSSLIFDYMLMIAQEILGADVVLFTRFVVVAELMSSFLEHDAIKQKFKGKLVATVLNGYLSLRR